MVEKRKFWFHCVAYEMGEMQSWVVDFVVAQEVCSTFSIGLDILIPRALGRDGSWASISTSAGKGGLIGRSSPRCRRVSGL